MPINRGSNRVLAIVPVYNEFGRIGKVVSKFSKEFVDKVCLIIDSPNKSIMNEIKNSANNIDVPLHIITNNRKRGIGYSIRLGINYARDNEFDIVVVLAGNNKDDPNEIPKFLDAITNNKFDYVQGSRFLPGGYHEKTPILRGIFIKLYPLIWTFLTGVYCTDVTNGFRAYKTEIFKDRRIDIFQDWLDSYELEYYLHYKVLTLGYNVMEIPVSKIYPYRNRGGYSKINPLRDFWNILRPLLYLALRIRS